MNMTYLETSTIDNLSSFLPKESLQELLECYLRDSQKILNNLDSVLSEKDVKEATRLVHSLKSTSANIGAMSISELAKELEALARDEQLDEIRARLDRLNELFKLSRGDIEQLDFMQA